MGAIVLVGGGVRSGKSRFALERARGWGTRLAFVATAQARDSEMRERAASHRQERGADFETIEEPLALGQVLARLGDYDAVVLDCLTLWLSNRMLASDAPSDAVILRELDEWLEIGAGVRPRLIIVSNEVGMGVHPETAVGRRYRDLVGRAHQCVSARAEEVYFGAMGLLLRLKPGPLATVQP